MKKILFCLLSVLAFVACSDDFMSFRNGENLVFTATIDAPQTRTSIARETGKVSWVEGDVILINGVEYVAHPDGDNAATATFTKRDENAANPVKNREGNYVATYGDVENQAYSPDGANCPMTATSANTNLSFANDCGVLRINANANGVEVSSVKVDNYILSCPDGVDITEAKDFYVALPAGTYNNLEIVFTGNGRNISTKVYNGELTIERNHIYPITFTEPLQFVDPLPGDYTEVNAIISSGTQYINTGVAPVSNTRVVLKDFIAYSTDIEWPVFFGVTNNDGGNTTWMFRRNGNKNSICSAIGSITSPYYNYIHENYTEGTRIEEVSLDRKNGLLINGVQAAKSAIDNDPVFASEPMYLFGGNNNGAFWRGSRMSISACKIYEGHNLVRDYVAVFRNSDSKPGLYDLVTKQFFTNQGTGEFSYTDPSMPEYSELEYIQSNRNQYINTGVIPGENTKVVLKDFCCLSYSTWDVCYGVTNDDGGANSWMMRIDGGNKHDLTSAIGNIKTSPYYNYRCSYTLGATVEEVSLDHQNGLSINGVQGTASAINNTPVYSSMPIFLFGGNQDGKFWRGSHMRIHGCQIYEGNTLVRDFVAMRRNADNVVGLYDRVEDKFYVNKGSGTFEAGPVVQDSNPEVTGTAPVLESAGCPNNECGWVQLWENGPKWAVFNVGVTDGKPESYGGYYAWGGMHNQYDDHNTGNVSLSGNNDTVINLWGSAWRMPTNSELQDLLDNCTCIWTRQNDVNGLLCTGKGTYSANSIFLPGTGGFGSYVDGAGNYGNYWSSITDNTSTAYHLSIPPQHTGFNVGNSDRHLGFAVRAVLAE